MPFRRGAANSRNMCLTDAIKIYQIFPVGQANPLSADCSANITKKTARCKCEAFLSGTHARAAPKPAPQRHDATDKT